MNCHAYKQCPKQHSAKQEIGVVPLNSAYQASASCTASPARVHAGLNACCNLQWMFCVAGTMQTFSLPTTSSVLPQVSANRARSTAAHRSRQPSQLVTVKAAVAGNGAATSNGSDYPFHVNDVFPPAQSEAISPEVQAILDDQGLDFETSGLKFLTNEARVRHHRTHPESSPKSVLTMLTM